VSEWGVTVSRSSSLDYVGLGEGPDEDLKEGGKEEGREGGRERWVGVLYLWRRRYSAIYKKR